MDPLTLARLWLLVRPIKRLKERRAAKRAARNQPPAPEAEFFNFDEKESRMGSEILGSVLRTAGPAAAMWLAGHGITVVGDNPMLTVAVAVAVYVGMQGWSLWRKVANKPRAA